MFSKGFLLLWQGQLVSQIGSQAYTVGLMFWLLQETGSAALMGSILMLGTLPGVVLGPVAGSIVDRHDRKKLLIRADLVRGVAVLVPALLLNLGASTALMIVVFLAIAVVNGLAAALFNPTIAASIPDLVPPKRLASANSLNQLSGQLATTLGQAAGGVAFRVLGAPLLFLVDAVSFLFSGASESFIDLPHKSRSTDAGLAQQLRQYWADAVEGLSHVRGRLGMLRFILSSSVINFFFMPVYVLLPFYVTEELGLGASGYGYLLATMGAGSFSVLLVVSMSSLSPTSLGRYVVVKITFLLIPFLIAVTGLFPTVEVVFPGFFAIGALAASTNVAVMTIIQQNTPSEFRGRVMALVISLSGIASPIGLLTGGLVGEAFQGSTGMVFLVAGTASLVLVFSLIRAQSVQAFLQMSE